MKKTILLILLTAVLCLTACGSSSGSTAQETSESETSNAYQTLVDDDNISIAYVRVFEANGLQGDTYMTLQVKNKTDGQISLALENPKIDDIDVTVNAESSTDLAAGKSTEMTFVIKNVTMMEFQEMTCQFKITDKSKSTIEETDTVTIRK